MLKVRIETAHGDLVVVSDAKTVTYVRQCKWQDHEFETEDPRKEFCCTSHRVRYFQKGIGRSERA